MPLVYLLSPTSGALVQGELLANVWEHWVPVTTELADDETPRVRSRGHPLVIVLTNTCDLQQDFTCRSQASDPRVIDEDRRSITCVQLCDLYDLSAARVLVPGSDIFKRVRSNQDERYHRLVSDPDAPGTPAELSDLTMDFRKMFTVPTGALYQGLASGNVRRLGVVPPIYVHDLIHRFFGYLGRVSLPDP